MRLSRVRRKTSLGMNMTPMIDIVFLLIIFFMTVSQITQSMDHPIDLPDVGPGGVALESVKITVNLSSSGQLIVASRPYQLPELMTAMRKELKQVNNNPSQLKILVRCDRDCPGKFVNELGQELAKLGVSRVRFSVRGEER